MHQYYYGGEQASLEATDVDAAWKSEPRALGLLNKAFEIYYNACNSIKQVNDDELRQKLTLSLDKAARYWYFMYASPGKVNTLVDGFQHLDKNDGRWTDPNTGTYNKMGRGIIGTQCAGLGRPMVRRQFSESGRRKSGEFARRPGRYRRGLRQS
jgi:hypothetical protein